MTFSKALRKAIRDSKQSFNQLAQQSRLTHGQLSRFMSGERDLTLQSADKLAVYFRLEVRPKAKAKAKRRKRV